MKKNFEPQIEMLLGLGIQDLEHQGQVSIREIVLNSDGTEKMFPLPGTVGISLNLHADSSRLYYKRAMQLRVEKGMKQGILLLYNNMITRPSDLLENPNGQSLYVLCMTPDGKIVVRQDYTKDEAGKVILGDRTVLDHDPEDNQISYGFYSECLLSFSDKQFASFPEEMWTKGLPDEWVEYVYRERKHRNEEEWSSLDKNPIYPRLPIKQGGQDEVLDAEETV